MKKINKFEAALWIGTICLVSILLVSHTYNDIVITTRHGINLWDILLDGNFLAFYDINKTVSGNSVYDVYQSCAYNILVYIVFAIWNLPLYLMERFAGVDVMNSIPCLVYAKLLPAAAMAVTALIIKKLLEALQVPKENHKLALYLYVSSTLLVTIIFLVGQYDILSLIFQLLGIYAFIKKNDKRFALWFGIAFCFKYFALVIFLPLLVLRHKKIIPWIKNLALLIIPCIITKLPFIVYGMISSSANGTGSGGDQMAASLLVGMFSSANVTACVNVFVVVYVALIVWCFLQKEDSGQLGHQGVWACMVAYSAFFGLMDAYPYWSVLLAPFVALSIAMAPRYFYFNSILETIGYAGMIGANMIIYHWVYFGYTLKPMIWSHILEGTRFSTVFVGSFIYNMVIRFGEVYTIPVSLRSLFIAAFGALAYTTYPRSTNPELQTNLNSREYWDVLIVRFLVNGVICLLPIIAVFV